jgi:O-antigen ligase
MTFYFSNKLSFNFLNFISLLCACLIPLLVTGPFLPNIIVSSLSIWFLYYSLKNKKYVIYKNIYFYIFIAFCVVCIISSFLSDEILVSLKSSLFYFRIGIFSLLIFYLIKNNKKILDYFYYSFIITFSVLIVDGYFQFLTGFNFFGYKLQGLRVSSFFGDELILGSYLSRLFPLFFALFIVRTKKSTFDVYFIFIIFVLTDVLIFLSGERIALLYLNLSTIFLILFLHQYKKLRIISFSISVIIISILLLKPNYYQHYIKRTLNDSGFNLDQTGIKNNEQLYIFSVSHDSHYKTAFNMFLDKPIFGQGPNLFRVKCYDYKYGAAPCSTHPHNFYIQLLAETGIVGFTFLFSFLIYFLYLIVDQIRQPYFNKRFSDYQMCILSGVLIFLFPFSPNGNFFSSHLMYIYSLQFGFFFRKL